MSTQIKNAKYRIKDENGNYQIIHFETSMEQVEGLDSKMEEVAGLINDRYNKSETDNMFRGVNDEINQVEAIAEGLNGRLTIAESNITSLQDGLAAEIARSTGVEEGLQQQIDALNADVEAINHPQSGILAGAKKYTDEEIAKLNGIVGDLEGSLGASSSELAGKIEELQGLVNSNKSETDAALEVVNGRLTAVTSRVDVLEENVADLRDADAELATEIQNIKNHVAGQGSDTKVFANMDEFIGANLTPKVGDMVFILDIKKAFIYRGADAPAVLDVANVPAGWVIFDEISTEIDLVDYAKKSEVEEAVSTLEGKITAEQGRAEAAEKALADSIASVQGNVDTHGERITALEGVTATHTSEINTLKETTYTKEQVDTIVDTEVTLAMNVMSTTLPAEVEKRRVGHVWIELI